MRPITDLQRKVNPFQVISDYIPSGDQPAAIAELAMRINAGESDVVLLGATGTGVAAFFNPSVLPLLGAQSPRLAGEAAPPVLVSAEPPPPDPPDAPFLADDLDPPPPPPVEVIEENTELLPTVPVALPEVDPAPPAPTVTV